MPEFRYRAYTNRGDLAEGIIEAASGDAATEALWARGLTPFATRQAASTSEKWWQREVFGRQRLSPAELAAFTGELALLEQAELPLDDTLRILAEQGSSARLRRLARDTLGEVLEGSHLSDVMARRPETFPLDYVAMVRAGEVGGTTDRVLGDLAELLERRLERRSRLRSALVYPAILVVMALASIAIILSVLVPSFAPIFAESGKPLPAGMSLLVGLRDHWLEALADAGIVAGLAAGLAVVAARQPGVRAAVDRAKLRLPVLGGYLCKRDVARFARTLATLLRAGVPLLQALGTARTVVVNRALAAGLETAVDRVREGESLSTALERIAGVPPLALRMIGVGEQAGRLDRVLLRIAMMFETETQRGIERFMALLNPALTLLIASIVGGLIFTVMNAILSVNDLALQ